MHSLYMNTAHRSFSILTQHIKARPTNLEMGVVERASDKKLVDFYSATYLKEDPVVRAAGIQDLSELQSFLEISLLSQHSVVLKEKTSGDVVAAASGGPVTYDMANYLRQHGETMKDIPSKRLVNLWASVMAETKLLDRLHVPTIWDVSYIATAPNVRGLGFSRFLLSQQCRLAAKLGYIALCVECTNLYLSKVVRREGFNEIPGRPVSSFLDPSGTPWILGSLMYPHNDIQVFYHILESRKIT